MTCLWFNLNKAFFFLINALYSFKKQQNTATKNNNAPVYNTTETLLTDFNQKMKAPKKHITSY